jgi:predicted P-loop ATPase
MPDSDKPAKTQASSRRLRLVEEPLWLAGSTRTKTGALVPNTHNAYLFLAGCPYLPSEFRFAFDEMLQAAVCGIERTPLTDTVVARLVNWFEDNGFRNFPKEYIRDAILIVADLERFNPLQQWLGGLKWDGCARLATWLHRYLGTPDNDYHMMVGSMFLRSMIARAMEPGCKADYMLVLEGPQRKLKSTVCEILARGYFSDSLPDLSGDPVRIAMHLRGKWVIEISEMHAFSRAEASRLKQFLSSKNERYTPKYGRFEVDEPRTCVFIGTTNKATYLRDETGGSRFWPVRCGAINKAALEKDIDQLLAEAYREVVIEQRAWWPPPDLEEKLFGPVQESRYDGDAWESLIADWDFMIPDTDPNGRPHVGDDAGRNLVYAPYPLSKIAFGALGIPPGQLDKTKEGRLIKTLEFMGWHRAKRTKHGIPWMAPEAGVEV